MELAEVRGTSERVLFTSVGAIGHVYPMVPLAHALITAGKQVQWACPSDVCAVVENACIPALPAGMTMASRQQHLQARLPDFAALAPDERTDAVVSWVFGESLAPAMLEDLLPIVQAFRPSLVIHDSMEFAGPIAAGAVGAINVAHSFGPLTLEHRILSIGERTAGLWERVGLQPRTHGGLYDYLYLDIYPPSLQVAVGNHVPHRQLLRPTPYPQHDRTPLPPTLVERSDRPLVYVTFGTEIPAERLVRLVIEALADEPVRLLLTVGNHCDPKTFGPQPAHVVIERFIPQTSILPHASVVVSHGGSGTVLAALGAGIPQLCLPYMADQPVNARAVSRAGAGLALEVAEVEPGSILGSVRRLLEDDSFRNQAGSVAAEIAGMPSPEQVVSALSALTRPRSSAGSTTQ